MRDLEERVEDLTVIVTMLFDPQNDAERFSPPKWRAAMARLRKDEEEEL